MVILKLYKEQNKIYKLGLEETISWMMKICTVVKELGNKTKLKQTKEVEILINKWEENKIKKKLHKNK